jgi:hypothetical protein
LGPRLLQLVDRLGHAARDGAFNDLRKSAEAHLAVAREVRDKTLTTFRCKPVIETERRTRTSLITGSTTEEVRTLRGVDVEPDQQRPFHVEAAALIDALWMRIGSQPPTGQAVVLVGTTGDRTEASGWVWMRIQPAKGPSAIILCSAAEASAMPAGRIALGGLMVGRWTPEGSAAAPAPAAAGSPAPGPHPAPLSQPVILAVVAAGGK